MNWIGYLSMSLYSIILLLFIYKQTINESDRFSLSHRLYVMMLQVAFALTVFDALSRLEQSTGIVFLIVNLSNAALFLLGVFMASVWLLYVDFQVFQDKDRVGKQAFPLILLNSLNVVMVLIAQFHGWLYYFDDKHIYHRGSLFILPGCEMMGIVVAATFLIVVHYKEIDSKYIRPLLLFPIPPVIGGIIQVAFYNIPLVLTGVTLSMLIIFVNVQNQNMNIDNLTGIFNRRKFDIYLNEKINSVSPNKTFSAILIDMDRFKDINDQWGHVMGDHALRAAASLLKKSTARGTFISRYGGDEFCIILDDTNASSLRKQVKKIRENTMAFNQSNMMPYGLSFSIGYREYDDQTRLSPKEFLNEIDDLMYQNKKSKSVRK